MFGTFKKFRNEQKGHFYSFCELFKKYIYLFTKLGDLYIRETHCYSCYLKFLIEFVSQGYNDLRVKGLPEELKHTPWILP